jgi:hypothetical protein
MEILDTEQQTIYKAEKEKMKEEKKKKRWFGEGERHAPAFRLGNLM